MSIFLFIDRFTYTKDQIHQFVKIAMMAVCPPAYIYQITSPTHISLRTDGEI